MLENILLVIHITCGAVALLMAVGAMVTLKGGDNHKRAGRVYAIAMTGIFLTALPLAFMGSNVFLTLIAVFSFYLVFAGYRFARNSSGKADPIDWIAVAIMGITGLGMWVYALIIGLDGDSQWVTLAIFGFIAVALSLADTMFHRNQPAPGVRRITRHLTNMMAGTIATVTAVLVVNLDTDPEWIVWLAPTVVITPIIVYWNFRIARQARGG